jgi:integrase/recombinase XerC
LQTACARSLADTGEPGVRWAHRRAPAGVDVAVAAGTPNSEPPCAAWLDERPDWPGADGPALFLNQRGSRLSVKGAHDVITAIADSAGLDDDTTTHVLRHTFATRLVRGGTDLIIVADLLGHARLETTRVYTGPTDEDRTSALDLLDVDE